MPHPASPEQITGNQEQPRCKGQESVPGFLPPAQHIQERIVLHQRERNEVGQDPQNSFPVNVHRILAVLIQPESKNIGEFQPVQKEEAQRRLYQENSAEQSAAPNQHERYRSDSQRRPADLAGSHGIDEDNDGLQDSGKALDIQLSAQNLQQQAAWAQHHPVKFPSADHAGKGLQAPGADFRQGE